MSAAQVEIPVGQAFQPDVRLESLTYTFSLIPLGGRRVHCGDLFEPRLRERVMLDR